MEHNIGTKEEHKRSKIECYIYKKRSKPKPMNYSNIKYYDIANGPGVRTSLFVSGCNIRCPHCFNKCTWDFNYGEPFTEQVQQKIIASLGLSYIQGLSILGGEPLEPENQREVLNFILKVKKTLPNKDIWLYTGFTFEELQGSTRAHTELTSSLLQNIQVMVDGAYNPLLGAQNLRFRGSTNQRVLDMVETMAHNSPIISQKLL